MIITKRTPIMANNKDFDTLIPLKEVMHRSLAIVKKNYIRYLIITVMLFIPLGIIFFINFYCNRNIEFLKNAMLNEAGISPYFTLYTLGYWFVTFIFYFYMNSVLAYMSYNDIIDKPQTLGQIAGGVAKLLLPVIVTALLLGVFVTLGGVVFIIPGIIILGFSVFVPQCIIIEKKVFYNAITRSFTISSGYLWQVLMTVIYYYAAVIVSTLIIDILVRLVVAGFDFGAIMPEIQPGQNIDNVDFELEDRLLIIKTFVLYLLLIISQPFLHTFITLKFLNIKRQKELQYELLNQ